jgi:dolichyl-phosphate beta-glucosyltransferase
MISLVIPVYNEEKIIGDTIHTIKTFMDNNFNDSIGYEVIFVNDGSKDNTLKIINGFINELCSLNDKIKVISYEKNKGKGGAVRTGMLAAEGDIIFFTDSDLAYGLDVYKKGYEIFEKNKEVDIIIGSRRKHKDGYASYTFLRKIMSAVFYFVLKIYGGIKQSDSQNCVKGFKKDAAKKIFNLCEANGWIFDFEVLLIADKLGFKIDEMPITIINHGESKVDPIKDSIKMLKEIPKIKKRIKKLGKNTRHAE